MRNLSFRFGYSKMYMSIDISSPKDATFSSLFLHAVKHIIKVRSKLTLLNLVHFEIDESGLKNCKLLIDSATTRPNFIFGVL